MLRIMGVMFICLSTFLAFCQAPPKYQVATIIDVKPHQPAGDASSDAVNYDISLKVDNTIYSVLYTPPLGMIAVRYAAGREILVLVGKKTITYNDILGNSSELPIVSRKAATDAKQPK